MGEPNRHFLGPPIQPSDFAFFLPCLRFSNCLVFHLSYLFGGEGAYARDESLSKISEITINTHIYIYIYSSHIPYMYIPYIYIYIYTYIYTHIYSVCVPYVYVYSLWWGVDLRDPRHVVLGPPNQPCLSLFTSMQFCFVYSRKATSGTVIDIPAIYINTYIYMYII